MSNKKQIIESITRRIRDEQRKHEHSIPDWQELAARKIYSSFKIELKGDPYEVDELRITENTLQPKLIQTLNFSKYKGKELILEEDCKFKNILFPKGTKFKIIRTKNSIITLKTTSPLEHFLYLIAERNEQHIRAYKSEIKTFDKIIKIWTEEKDKFVIDKDAAFKGGLHTINTGYHNIPKDHPEKGDSFSGDAIQTYDYKHKGGKTNIYSYQKDKNRWYSKSCYEFMRLRTIEQLKEQQSGNKSILREIYNQYYAMSINISISTLNKKNFTIK